MPGGLVRVAGEPRLQIWGDGNKPPSAASSGWLGPYIDNALPKIDVAQNFFPKRLPSHPAQGNSEFFYFLDLLRNPTLTEGLLKALLDPGEGC
jgi:hypothetical protein